MRKRELDKFKQKLESLKHEIIDVIRISNDNINVLNTISSSEEADIGSVKSISEIDENTLNKNNENLKEIKNAITKIETNKYGKCEMCTKEINIKRLMAKPYARFCITCREIYEKQNYKISKFKG